MRDLVAPSAIPLFDRTRDPSSVPANIRKADTRSGGQTPAPDLIRVRAPGRRECALPWTGASTPARWFSVSWRACLFVMVLSLSSCCGGGVQAKPMSEVHLASSSPAGPFASFIAEASQRFGIPGRWIRAVMHVESGSRPRETSSKGAIGLMQIMPKTWIELRARYGFGSDPYDPRDNILAGAAYLREMYDRYGAPGFLAAYNAGPGRYDRRLASGRALPAETRAYVAKLAPMIEDNQTGRRIVAVAKSSTWASSPLFAVRIVNNSSLDWPSLGGRPDRRSSGLAIVDLSALAPHSVGLFVHRANEARSQ